MKNRNRVKITKTYFTKPSKRQKKMLKYLNACLEHQKYQMVQLELLFEFSSYSKEHSFEELLDTLNKTRDLYQQPDIDLN